MRAVEMQAMEVPRDQPRPAPVRRDPILLMLGAAEHRDWFAITAALAFAVHASAVSPAIASGMLADIHAAVDDSRGRLHEFFWRTYDIEIPKEKPKPEEKPPEPEPPPPEPEPKPAPVVKAPPPKDDDPYKNLPPPAPAKAGAVLTRKEDPDEPKDLTGNTVVTGDGTATYGMVSAAGTGTAPTFSPNASNHGVPGGRGTATAAPVTAPPTEDRSRPVSLGGSSSWNCPFPPEADADDINQAVVPVQVTVKPDGSPSAATVVGDPGHGFGRAARSCALTRHYQPALDRSGTAILSSALLNVRFTR
jgi:protein TonB